MAVDELEYDVAIVGGGPAGLATAIRLKQLAAAAGREVSVCLLEKGAEIGAHTLSGAVIETGALEELIPDWAARSGGIGVSVIRDEFRWLTGSRSSLRVPSPLVPASMHNHGNRIVSLARLCRWLGGEAEALGVDVFAGFPAGDLLFGDDGSVTGIVTGATGLRRDGSQGEDYEPGMPLRARYTVLAEGARGHLARRLIREFELDDGCDPQHYGLGLKELWEVDTAHHEPGLVVHGAGWPLGRSATGGFFLYHGQDAVVSLGLVVDLNYRNPWLDPFREFQRLKHHPLFSRALAGARRIAYGARTIAKGGQHSLPQLAAPGALLVGCAAGTLNVAKMKGTHTALKSGMLAAEALHTALIAGRANDTVREYADSMAAGVLANELRASRNFGPAMHRFGMLAGGLFNLVEQSLLRGRSPVALRDRIADHSSLARAARAEQIAYPDPDGILSFDRMSSVYLSGTNHRDDQPSHLLLADRTIATDTNLREYAGPEQRYCPAGVYEFAGVGDAAELRINAQNCVHCKACDVKDPRQNITWVPPESGGPLYGDM